MLPHHVRTLAAKATHLADALARHAAELDPRYLPLLDAAAMRARLQSAESALAAYESDYAASRSLAEAARATLRDSLAAERARADAERESALAARDAEIAELEQQFAAKRAERKAVADELRTNSASRLAAIRAEGAAAITSHAARAAGTEDALQAEYARLRALYREYQNLVEAAFADKDEQGILADFFPREARATRVAAPASEVALVGN